MSIDKVDDNYEVGILIANSKKEQSSSKEGESSAVVYTSKGKTISEALKNIDLKNPRQTYIGHLSVIVISEEVAKEGLINTLDYLLRNPESTKRFYMVIAKKNKAKDIIKVMSPLETFPSQTISTNIKASNESQAVSNAITYSKFIETLLKKGMNPILPTIEIEGNPKKGSNEKNLQEATPNAILKLDTLAIFKKDKLLGYANKDESRGINLMMDKLNEMITVHKCKNNYLVTSLSSIKINKKIKYIDNNFIGNIEVKATGNITENNCNLKLSNPKVIKKIKKNIEKEIKKNIKKGLKKIQQEFNTDIIGFGNLAYKENYKKFNKIDNWDNYFKEMKINIKVDINLNTKGSAREAIKEAIYENKNK